QRHLSGAAPDLEDPRGRGERGELGDRLDHLRRVARPDLVVERGDLVEDAALRHRAASVAASYFLAAPFLSSLAGAASPARAASHLSSTGGIAASLSLAAAASPASAPRAASRASATLLASASHTLFWSAFIFLAAPSALACRSFQRASRSAICFSASALAAALPASAA